jgi:hypothetical protein
MAEFKAIEPALADLMGQGRRQDFRTVIGRMVRMILAPLFIPEAQRVARAMERHARRVLRDMDQRPECGHGVFLGPSEGSEMGKGFSPVGGSDGEHFSAADVNIGPIPPAGAADVYRDSAGEFRDATVCDRSDG